MMRMMLSFLVIGFAAAGEAKASKQSPLVGLQELGAGAAWDTVAVAPITTAEPIDGLRATVNYFESLADSASTPLLVFLPTQSGSIWHDGNREDVLARLQDMEEGEGPRWVVFTHINGCETQDYASKAFWREAGWVWSGSTKQFCIPKARATLTATLSVVDVSSGETVASSEVEATSERAGPMVRLHESYGGIRCASSPALHAKAKGRALREIGSNLAYEVDRLLGRVMFES